LYYYAVIILGIGELGPVNPEEMIYMIFVLLMSSIMNALIFSDIAVLVGFI
jgi:hypothetical protein